MKKSLMKTGIMFLLVAAVMGLGAKSGIDFLEECHVAMASHSSNR